MIIEYSFSTIALAIVKLFILIAIGYVIYYRKIIDERFLDVLSQLLVRIIMPCLIISKTISHFSPSDFTFWWLLPLVAVLFPAAGMILAWVSSRFGRRGMPWKEYLCSVGFQNCGYLPMNIFLFAFSGPVKDRLLIYVFLYITGFNILMWSVVPGFLSGSLKKGMDWKTVINAPVLATVFSVLWVFTMGTGTMPELIMTPIRQFGETAFPLAMVILGAYLYRYRSIFTEGIKTVFSGIMLKLLIFPAIVLLLVHHLPIASDLRFFLFLESIMPTAVSLVIVGAYTGADNRFFSGIIFYSHVFAIITVPVWLEIFNLLQK